MSTVALREPALSRFAAATAVYGGGFIIGATLVSFPASSAFLRATHGFTDAQYGAIYLPQFFNALIGQQLEVVIRRAKDFFELAQIDSRFGGDADFADGSGL